jgi:hypothetical protein
LVKGIKVPKHYRLENLNRFFFNFKLPLIARRRRRRKKKETITFLFPKALIVISSFTFSQKYKIDLTSLKDHGNPKRPDDIQRLAARLTA